MPPSRFLIPSVFFAGSLALFALPLIAEAACHTSDRIGQQTEYRSARMLQRHQKLHASLKLSAEQESAWDKLLVSEAAQPKPDAMHHADWNELSMPERAERMLEHQKIRQAAMTEHLVILKAFYNILDTAQKKTFDDFHAAPARRPPAKPLPPAPRAAVAP